MGSTENAAFAEEHAAWHAGIEAWRSGPHGPLSIVGLNWLDETPRPLPGVPGLWSASDGIATVVVDPAEGLAVDGEPIAGEAQLGPFVRNGPGTLVEWGEKRIQVAERSGEIVVRPHDPSAELRSEYEGTATFPPDPKWAVTARFEPDFREAVQVDTIVDGKVQYYDSPGRAVFELEGQERSLTLFGAADAANLVVYFWDETAKDLTYPAVRFLSATRNGDEVSIDFNRAFNPPCAYSTNATCPFPPVENRLPLRVEAGELRPGVTA